MGGGTHLVGARSDLLAYGGNVDAAITRPRVHLVEPGAELLRRHLGVELPCQHPAGP
ncbi:MAG: hypothetical protein WKF83_14910 [Nocardioidaceae bacterium]